MIERTSLSLLLKRYRMDAGLSQEALAQRADLSTRAISDLERGLHRSPRGTTLDLLASALSLSAQQRVLLLAAARPELVDDATRDAAYSVPSPTAKWLPTPLTTLIGRERESAQILAMLQTGAAQLVTLIGPSGVGKTRLVLHIAHTMAPAFGDGAAFVDLAPVEDAARVPGAVAQAVHLWEQGRLPLDQQVFAHLRERNMLLVLDNFEQVVESAVFVSNLLQWCPRLTLIVTSRGPLHLRGERLVHVAPLPLQDALVLFRERAHAVRHGETFAMSDIASICERVDCLPLAIELAAGQVTFFSTAHILSELDQRLGLGFRGARDLPARQQTMNAAIAWGYDLLTPEQQWCFRALGVFAGAVSLPAARAVWRRDEMTPETDVLPMMAALVDANLVCVEIAPDGQPRFSLLSLMRDFARERLCDVGEEETFARRHAAYFANLARALMSIGIQSHVGIESLAEESDNVRAALEWACGHGDAELAMQLVGFARVWDIRGAVGEAEQWLERALSLDSEARERGARSVPMSLRVERLYGFARMSLNRGRLERAQTKAEQAVKLAQQIDDEDGMANAFATLGLIAQARGDSDQAVESFTESVAHADRASGSELAYRARYFLAESARLRGDFVRARALLEQALAGAKSADNAWDCAITMTMLAHLERLQHDNVRARPRYLESLKQFHAFGSPAFFAWCLEGYSALLGGEGRHAQAARLCAAAVTLRDQANAPLPAPERAAFEDTVNRAREALGAAQFTAEWSTGSSYTQAMAIAEAMNFG